MNDWSLGFLEQAKSDFKAADSLSMEFPSQTTMLLQMAWEKLAKAALVDRGSWDPMSHRHAVAEQFVFLLKRMPQAQVIFPSGSTAQFRRRMTFLQDDLLSLEKLTPALSQDGVNAEYPWLQRDARGDEIVCWPSKDMPRRFCLPDPGAQRIRKAFDAIVSNFNRIVV